MPATLLSSGFAFYPSYHLSLLKRFILISTAIPITDRPFCPRHGAGSLDFHWCVLGRLPSQKAVGVEWWMWSAMGATGPLPKPWEVGKLGVRKCSWPGIQMGATGKNQESSGGSVGPETPLLERLWSGEGEYGYQVTSRAGARLLGKRSSRGGVCRARG